MPNKELDKLIARQSIELHEAVLRGDAGAAEKLDEHLCESRRHAQHYLRAALFDEVFKRLDAGRKWDSHSNGAERPSNVVRLPVADIGTSHAVEQVAPRRLFRPWSLVAGLVMLLVLGSLGWLKLWNGGWDDYSTRIGEQRAVELADGSIVHLNTQSHLQARINGTEREIRLLTGEALFKVHHDKTRPFRVHAGDVVVRAVGTEFNVYRRPEGTTVDVVEGRVRVESEAGSAEAVPTPALPAEPRSLPKAHRAPTTDLTAGERARVSKDGEIATERTTDVSNATAWRQRRLIFKGTPLSQMVEEFNRYNRTPRLQLEGEVAARPYSGIFDADDPESLISLLEHEPGVNVERKGDVVVIRTGGAIPARVIAETNH